MYYSDLTPYEYGCYGNDASSYFNIGWLQAGKEFPIGECPEKFVRFLFRMCCKPINRYRGVHICDLCSYEIGANMVGGNGEIEAISIDGKGYRAPAMIYHYVTVHKYQPPEEFIHAVLQTKGGRIKRRVAGHEWGYDPNKLPFYG